MKNFSANLIIVLALLSTTAPLALANSASCKSGNNTRKVDVNPIDASQPNSCAVSYLKETETPGATQILWQAKTETQYCIDKAKAFVEKLQGMGWACDGDLATSAAPEAAK